MLHQSRFASVVVGACALALPALAHDGQSVAALQTRIQAHAAAMSAAIKFCDYDLWVAQKQNYDIAVGQLPTGQSPAVLDPDYPFPCFPVASARPVVPAGGSYAWAPKLTFGITVGGAAITSLPTASTSGFYSGNLDTAAVGFLSGVQAFVDVARFGNAPGPFGSVVLSAGVVVDYIAGTPLQWDGLCGGFPCKGDGQLNELNVIGELKATTPIFGANAANVYVGAGVATLWPTGRPTGIGGPSIIGHDTAPAWRVGVGVDHQFTETVSAGLKVGFQHTSATEFDTTLRGERFRFDNKNEMIFGVTLSKKMQQSFLP